MMAYMISAVGALVGILNYQRDCFRDESTNDSFEQQKELLFSCSKPQRKGYSNLALQLSTIIVVLACLTWEFWTGVISFGDRFEIASGVSITHGKPQDSLSLNDSNSFRGGAPFVMASWIRLQRLEDYRLIHFLPLVIGGVISVAVIFQIVYERYMHKRTKTS